MIKEIIIDMAQNGILPIAIFENTLHVYYKKSWYAIEDDQYSELCPLNDDIYGMTAELNRLTGDISYD